MTPCYLGLRSLYSFSHVQELGAWRLQHALDARSSAAALALVDVFEAFYGIDIKELETGGEAAKVEGGQRREKWQSFLSSHLVTAVILRDRLGVSKSGQPWPEIITSLFSRGNTDALSVVPSDVVDGQLLVYVDGQLLVYVGSKASDDEVHVLQCLADQLQPGVQVQRAGPSS